MARSEIPPCAAAMGCLCAGHARGDPASAECNTDERPAPRRANARDVQMKIMLTEHERVEIQRVADKEGETVSTYVRRAIREQVRRDKLRRSTVI